MSTAPKELNWVAGFANCSIQSLFQDLARLTENDVANANEVARQQAPSLTFFHRRNGPEIIVTRRKVGSPDAAVAFELSNQSINVKGKKPGVSDHLFALVPAFTEDGECLVRIVDIGGDDDGRQLRLWQVTRKALEELFFRP